MERNFQPDSHAMDPVSSVWPVAPHSHTRMHVAAGRMTGSRPAAAVTLPQSGHTRRCRVPFDDRIRPEEWAALVSVSGIWIPAAASAAAAVCDQTCVTSHYEQGSGWSRNDSAARATLHQRDWIREDVSCNNWQYGCCWRWCGD